MRGTPPHARTRKEGISSLVTHGRARPLTHAGSRVTLRPGRRSHQHRSHRGGATRPCLSCAHHTYSTAKPHLRFRSLRPRPHEAPVRMALAGSAYRMPTRTRRAPRIAQRRGRLHVCHHCCSGLLSRAGGESLSPRAGALQQGQVGASHDLSHLRMHARWYACLHRSVSTV